MKQLALYVCPVCHNLITATAKADISCCDQALTPLRPAQADEHHLLAATPVEDELYVTAGHEMSKDHHLSFVAYVTGDRFLMMKLYPEWDMQVRLPKLGRGTLYFYCTRHGLFSQTTQPDHRGRSPITGHIKGSPSARTCRRGASVSGDSMAARPSFSQLSEPPFFFTQRQIPALHIRWIP